MAICPNCKEPVGDKSDHIEGEFEDPGTWWYACPTPPHMFAGPQQLEDELYPREPQSEPDNNKRAPGQEALPRREG